MRQNAALLVEPAPTDPGAFPEPRRALLVTLEHLTGHDRDEPE